MRIRNVVVALLAALTVVAGCSNSDAGPDKSLRFPPGTFSLTWSSTRDIPSLPATPVTVATNRVMVLKNSVEIGATQTTSSLSIEPGEVAPVHAVWLVGDGVDPRRVAAFSPDALAGRGVQSVDLDPWTGEREVWVTTEMAETATTPSPDPFLVVALN